MGNDLRKVRRFYVQLAVLTLLLSFLIVTLSVLLPAWVHRHSWYALAYNATIAMVSFVLLSKGLQKDAFGFNNYFMGTSAIRLLVSAIVLTIYILLLKKADGSNRVDLLHFLATFFIFYILYTVFEIKTLMANLRRNLGES